MRSCFAEHGSIENVRLVRDPKTFLGKGIGYIKFHTKDQMEECLRIKGGKDAFKFKGRELRISRAIEPKRREKKARRKEERKQERLQKRLAKA